MSKPQRIVVCAALALVAAVLFWSFAAPGLFPRPTQEQWAYGEKPERYLDPLRQAVPGVVVPILLVAAAAVVALGSHRRSPAES